MKPFIVILLAACIFTSCASTNRIIEKNNSKKDGKSFRLIQNPKAHTAEKSRNTLINQFFNIQTTYLFEEQTDQKPIVMLEFLIQNPIQIGKTDSVLFLRLDNENIRIISNKNNLKMAEITKLSDNYKENNKLITNQFIIPENLWLSVANSGTIIYKLNSGNVGIEIKLDPVETIKVKEFFSQAMQCRLEIIPLVPAGKSKW